MDYSDDVRDYRIDNPQFIFFKHWPISWGTTKLTYLDGDHFVSVNNTEAWEYHENNMLKVPDTTTIIEECGLFIGSKLIYSYEICWNNIPPVVAEIACEIGRMGGISRKFYYRDTQRAKDSWKEIVDSVGTESKIINQDKHSITIGRILEKEFLNDPDNYIKASSYFGRIKALHRDRNHVIERWAIQWKQPIGATKG